MNIRPNDLLTPTRKVIKPYDGSLIAVDGPNLVNKFKMCDIEIPYDSEFSTTITLPANSTEFQSLSYGNMDNLLTFLAMNVRYMYNTSQNSTVCKDLPKHITYYFESNPNVRYSMGEFMVLTGTEEQKIERIFLKNESPYGAEIRIMGANKGDDIINIHPKVLFRERTEFFEMIKQEDLDMICPITVYEGDEDITLTGDVSLYGTVENLNMTTFKGTVVLTGACKVSKYIPEFEKIVEMDGKTVLRINNFSITDFPTHIGENVFTASGVSITGKPQIIGEITTIGWTKDTLVYKYVDKVTNFDESKMLFEPKNILLTGFTKDKLITLSSETNEKFFPRVNLTMVKDKYGNKIHENKDFMFEKGEYVIDYEVDTKDDGKTDGRYQLQRKIY